jgi:hypothetical protein
MGSNCGYHMLVFFCVHLFEILDREDAPFLSGKKERGRRGRTRSFPCFKGLEKKKKKKEKKKEKKGYLKIKSAS